MSLVASLFATLSRNLRLRTGASSRRARRLVVTSIAIAGLLPLVAVACSSSSEPGDKTPVSIPVSTADLTTPVPPTSVPVAASTPSVAVAPGSVPADKCGPDGSAIAGIKRDNVRKYSAAPQLIINPSKAYTANIHTSKGDIIVDLDATNAPVTTNNFVFLACHGFYDGLTFHRVVKTPSPFVIQGGDPNGDGTGGPGYAFKNEVSTKLTHVLGAIAMANSGPDTNGSQFYITLSPQPALDGKYNVFGKVNTGQDVANNIAMGDKIISVGIQEK